MEKKDRLLAEMATATEYPRSVSDQELFELLGYKPDEDSLELIINKIMSISDNEAVSLLSPDKRLAVLRAAQEFIGKLFLTSLEEIKDEQI